jgi:hypothetical protein
MSLLPETPAELKYEWNYRYSERLGLLDVVGIPTPEQKKMATEDADAAVKAIQKEGELEF